MNRPPSTRQHQPPTDEAEGRLLLVTAAIDISDIGAAYLEDLWVPGIYEVRVPVELSDAHAASR